MIHCWVNHRLLSQSKAGAAVAAAQSVEDDGDVCERTSSAGNVAPLVRYPGLKLQAASGATAFKTDHKEDWMFTFCLREKATDQEELPDASITSVLSTKNPERLYGQEDANFHKEVVETSTLSASSSAAEEIVENRKIPLCRLVPGSDTVSTATSGDSQSQMLSSDMVSAIKNVVRNAVDSLNEEHSRRDSMDFIADDLLRELERAAAQVADMEVEMRFLKERVKESETRGQHLEQTLAKVLEKHPITDAGEADNPTSPLQLHCCRHNCSMEGFVGAVQDTTQRRLSFLEDICRQKDVTIVELEHQINTLQSKISKMLNAKEEQQRMGVPVTIKELLVKIGSTETSRHSQPADSSDNLSSESTARKRSGSRKVHAVKKSGHSRHCSQSILVDMTPNALIDRRVACSVQSSNPAAKENLKM